MKSITRYIALTLLCLSCFYSGFANGDSTNFHLEVREFDQQVIDSYKADDQYDYGYREKKSSTLWDRFLAWLAELIGRLFYFGTESTVGKYLFIGLLAAVVIYALFKIFKIRTNLLIQEKSVYDSTKPIENENIHELDLEFLIQKELDAKNYRNAIRLTYLLALKQLSTHDKISWKPGKTSHDYLNELESPALRNGLYDLNYYFSYSWYGHFEVEAKHYQAVKEQFTNLYNVIK